MYTFTHLYIGMCTYIYFLIYMYKLTYIHIITYLYAYIQRGERLRQQAIDKRVASEKIILQQMDHSAKPFRDLQVIYTKICRLYWQTRLVYQKALYLRRKALQICQRARREPSEICRLYIHIYMYVCLYVDVCMYVSVINK